VRPHPTTRAAIAAAALVSFPIASSVAFPAVAAAAPTVSAQDKAFLVAAHQSNLSEIAAGNVAEQKATSSAVREHGRLFIQDHARLDGNLKAVASALEVALPSQPTAQQRSVLASVSAKTGNAFDRAWVSAQITGHRQAIALGKQELASGTNARVIALDKAAAPVVASHLQMLLSTAGATSVHAGMGGASFGSGANKALPWALVVGGAAATCLGIAGLRRRDASR
jgi:putative membrane protein